MQVKKLIKLLRRFKNSDLLINGTPVSFEIYQDQNSKFFIDLKILEDHGKSLDKTEKL